MQTFEEKVRSMSGAEIIMAMVDSLIPPPAITVDMQTYGTAKLVKKYFFGLFKKYKCFGCAATNTICHISGKVFTYKNIEGTEERAAFIGTNYRFLSDFESAIDRLRTGNLESYNYLAREREFAQIKNPLNIKLPELHTNYTTEQLQVYIDLANSQDAVAPQPQPEPQPESELQTA